ncbi:MAG: NTP transferase domain-containing protein [Bacteroidia bacterium]|nr:NTP transferase domain-containing protein [Bacteroidia bacterium]
MKGYIYILKCSNGAYYTGSTNNLELRMQEHQNGEGANFTKKHLPVELVYFEIFQRIDEAFYREKQVQGWSRAKKEALIKGFTEKLHELAECKNETHYKNAPFGSAQCTDAKSLSEAETTDTKLPVIILAAGNSERMGFPKAFLKWDKNTDFIEKIIRQYINFGSAKIVVILNEKNYEIFRAKSYHTLNNVQPIVNSFPEHGRFYSVKLGLSNIGDSDYCFVQNVDNPFIITALLNKLFDSRVSDSYITPVYKGKGGHPVLLSRKIIKDISEIAEDNLNLKEILSKYRRIEVESGSPVVLYNINTMDDYLRYFPK